MNTLGKILVFFVLILSVIWNYLVVNAYATRTNYKAELDNTRKLYAEAAKSADALKKQLEELKSASDAVVAQHVASIRNLEAKVKNAEDAAQQANNEQLKGITDRSAKVQNIELLKSDNITKDGQISILQSRNTGLNNQVNDSTIAEQKAKNEALAADIERRAALSKAEKTEKDLLNANEQLQNAKRGGTGGIGVDRIPPTDPDFRAVVTTVDSGVVEINQGTNNGLQKGAVLDLSRPSAKKYVGKLVIERTTPFSATGRFVPLASVTRPMDDDLPKKDDLVSIVK
jgi:hypothetical protein